MGLDGELEMSGWQLIWDPCWPLGIQAKGCFSCQLTEPHCVASKTHPFPSPDTSPLPNLVSNLCIFPLFSDFFGSILLVMSTPPLCAWCWLQLASVLVCSSCYNATDWVAYKQQKLTSHSSGGWEVQDQGSGQFNSYKSLLFGFQMAISYCVSSYGCWGEVVEDGGAGTLWSFLLMT